MEIIVIQAFVLLTSSTFFHIPLQLYMLLNECLGNVKVVSREYSAQIVPYTTSPLLSLMALHLSISKYISTHRTDMILCNKLLLTGL
jgi:hypothetical protein